MHILVLAGGNSSEREVSLRSADAVTKALKLLGHKVSIYDTKDGYHKIKQHIPEIDVVFPILHGPEGEDGKIQDYLEGLKVLFLGAKSEPSDISFYKHKFKQHIVGLNIKTPEWEVVTKKSFSRSPLIKKPYVLKPLDEGSSIDTYLIKNPGKPTPDQLDTFTRHLQMLLEEYISGVEITVPVLGNKSLPVIEIIPPEGHFFDYENKYNGATQELCPPKNVSKQMQTRVRAIAEQIHSSIGIRHLSRTDMIIRGKDIFVLELNTMPGMTDESLFPKAAQVAGMSMPELMQKFIDLSLEG